MTNIEILRCDPCDVGEFVEITFPNSTRTFNSDTRGYVKTDGFTRAECIQKCRWHIVFRDIVTGFIFSVQRIDFLLNNVRLEVYA